MPDTKALLGDQLPKIALAIMAAKQHGPQASAALMQGIQESQMQRQQLARQQQMDTQAQEQQQFNRQNVEDDNARQDEAARMDRVQRALALIQSRAQQDSETATDPELAQQGLQQTAQSAAGMFGVDPTQLSSMVPNIAPAITKRKQKQALERYTALQKIYGEEAVATDSITDNGEQFKGLKPSQILALAQMGATTPTGEAAQPYVKPTPVPAADRPPTPGTFEDFVVRKYGAQPTPEQILEGRRLYQQSDDRPPAISSDPNGLRPAQEFSISERLAKAWTDANKSTKEMSRQLTLMETGLKQFRAGNRNAGSQAVLVTFQKILDPTSVVRESEYARTAAGQSLLARIEGAAERLSKGGAGLTDAELNGMVQTAQTFLSEMQAFNQGTRKRIEAQVKKYQIDPATVFDDVLLGSDAPGAVQPPAGASKKYEIISVK